MTVMQSGRSVRAFGNRSQNLNRSNHLFNLLPRDHTRPQQYRCGPGQRQNGRFNSHGCPAAIQQHRDSIAQSIPNVLRGGGRKLGEPVGTGCGNRDAGFLNQRRVAQSYRAHPNDSASFANGCIAVSDDDDQTFIFQDQRPDLEQAVYVEDLIHLNKWTISAGLRYDHYQLILNDWELQPRFSVSRYIPFMNTVFHFSYDRIFQTPSYENILLSSSAAAEALDTSVPAVQKPVEPSQGNYYELGATKGFLGKLRVDANMFRRDVDNYADDSQILSTGISFPIAFRKAILYGAEAKLEVPHWGRFSGFASYSYIVGNVWNPVTGGLFLGDDATGATTDLTGHFPDSQDQRQTIRARVRYQLAPRLWIALGSDYNSGLPFQPDLTAQQYATEYGQVVISHLNFNRDRISPYLTESFSVGADLYQQEKRSVRLQADAQNLSNELEVVDFGGLFSGNALGPSRQYTFRLVSTF